MLKGNALYPLESLWVHQAGISLTIIFGHVELIKHISWKLKLIDVEMLKQDMYTVKCSLLRIGRDTESDNFGLGSSGKATLPFGGLHPGVLLSLASVAFM